MSSKSSKKTRREKLVLTSKPYYRRTEDCPSDQYPPKRVKQTSIKTHTGKSILRYPGGKTRATKLILPRLMAQEAKRLISPFFGGGSIEFAWAAANPDGWVDGADLYPPVVEFWQCALTKPSEVARRVQGYFPLSRDEFYTLQKNLGDLNGLDLAAAFYVLNRSSFSGATMSGGMSPGHKRFTQSAIDRLSAFKAPNVQVTYDDAFSVLEQCSMATPKGQVIYLDPPYKLNEAVLYGDKGNMHRGFDHEKLAMLCRSLSDRGWQILLSYNNDATIKSLYEGFRIEEAQWAYGMKNVSGTPMGDSSEVLIFSPSWRH